MHRFFLVCLFATLGTACGRTRERTPDAREPALEKSGPSFRADCVIPGETESQCLAYHLVQIFP